MIRILQVWKPDPELEQRFSYRFVQNLFAAHPGLEVSHEIEAPVNNASAAADRADARNKVNYIVYILSLSELDPIKLIDICNDLSKRAKKTVLVFLRENNQSEVNANVLRALGYATAVHGEPVEFSSTLEQFAEFLNRIKA